MVRLSNPPILNLMILISSSILSFCLHSKPSYSVKALPSFLSARAIVSWTYLSRTFFVKNFERDFGILPFMSLEMHLKASAVLLNL